MEAEDIDRDEAIRRYRAGDAATVLKRQVTAKWPETFAGIWLDRSRKHFNVSIAFTKDASANVDWLRSHAGFPYPRYLRAVTLPLSFCELEAIGDVMLRDRTLLQKGTPPSRMPQIIRDTKGQYSFGTETQTSTIIVSYSDASDALLKAFRSLYTERIKMNTETASLA